MADDRLHFAGFDIAFRGRSIDVVVLPRAETDPSPTVDAIVAALKRTPIDRPPRALIGRALEAAAEPAAEVRIPVGQVQVGTDDPAMPCAIVLSADALAAYAVPAVPNRPVEAPPAGDAEAGAEPAAPPRAPASARVISAGQLRQLLEHAKVTTGLLEDVIAGFGTGKALSRITCLATGEPAIAGVDGVLEYHFDRNPKPVPRERADGSVDFHSMIAERFVAPEAVLVTRHAPVPEREGMNVLGDRILVPPAADVALAPLVGEHTEVRGDELVATLGGRPVWNAAGRIDVMPVFEVPGDLGYGVGNVDFPGDVIVRGDVKTGFEIVAAGSVIVQGLVEAAKISAGHDLTVMGVVGEHGSVFSVGGDLTAQYLHTTNARVGGTVQVAREILNSRIVAGRVAMGGTGRLVGGSTTAETEIDAGTLGASNGMFTEVAVQSRAPSAVIRARRTAHAGVVVRVGGARREITDELEAVSFWDVAGTLLTLRAGAEERDVEEAQQRGAGAA